MEKPTYSGRRVVTVLGIIVVLVVTLVLVLFFNGPRVDLQMRGK
jgi:hypothetical protein